MMKNLLLLDSDAIIDLHKIGYWTGVLANYSVHVGSIAANSEVKHYWDVNKDKVEIDLHPYINRKEIIELSALPADISAILKRLGEPIPALDGLHAGELECITIMVKNEIPELNFCTIDTLAITAMAYLGLESKAISVEEILVNRGILRRGTRIHPKYTKKRFRKIITEGKFLAVQVESRN